MYYELNFSENDNVTIIFYIMQICNTYNNYFLCQIDRNKKTNILGFNDLESIPKGSNHFHTLYYFK